MKTTLRAQLARLSARLVVLGCALAAGVAWASGERNPFDYSVITYLWVLAVSALGGLVNFHRKMREGQTRAFNVTEFLGELVTSAFAGLLTFWLCESANIDRLVAAVMIAVSGHMGSRAIFGFEKWMESRVTPATAASKPARDEQ
jgi:hypothetical protein